MMVWMIVVWFSPPTRSWRRLTKTPNGVPRPPPICCVCARMFAPLTVGNVRVASFGRTRTHMTFSLCVTKPAPCLECRIPLFVFEYSQCTLFVTVMLCPRVIGRFPVYTTDRNIYMHTQYYNLPRNPLRVIARKDGVRSANQVATWP